MNHCHIKTRSLSTAGSTASVNKINSLQGYKESAIPSPFLLAAICAAANRKGLHVITTIVVVKRYQGKIPCNEV